MCLIRAALLSLLLAATVTPAQALVMIGFSAERHNRFASGWPTSPVPNTSANFVGFGYDWSGVGWSADETYISVAMISSQYFVYSAHRQFNKTLQFFSPTLNSVVQYTWPGSGITLKDPWTGVDSDFAIGKLDNPLDPAHGIATYPIFDLGLDTNAYIGLPLLTYGRGPGESSPRVGIDTVAGFDHLDLRPYNPANPDNAGDGTDDTYTVYHTHTDSGPQDSTHYEVGDSNSPLFVPFRGRLAILGTHSAVGQEAGTWYSYDNFIPVYLNQMMDLDIPFTTVPEPEAGTVLFLLAVAGFGLLKRKGQQARSQNPRQ
ncbi:MAG: hypothetical protein HXY24_12080 [Rubrivivax sp.]|nr:hypothetical protein [Rubrivivax sp.]